MRNLKTNEIFDVSMKISEREEYFSQNPDIEQVLTTPGIVDPVRVGVRKHDSSFDDVLKKAKNAHRHSNINI